ncbi:transposase [Sulfobacillus thermosulfidooxidans]|uniref:transposase n=1 Tax=Sulfobacillus thermosulfidooxidans TaxID=28034 RepID=UPI003D6DA5FA
MYGKPSFWPRAYYVGSVGNATLKTVKRYVAAQETAATRLTASWLSPKKGNARALCLISIIQSPTPGS